MVEPILLYLHYETYRLNLNLMNEKLTIFYADDDIDDLEFFKLVIKRISDSYEVVTYLDGYELLEALNNPPPAPFLLFLDINMPRINGLEVLKKLRESDKYLHLPVIMLSTTKDGPFVQKSMDLGANYYVPKSSRFEDLRQSIEHSLKIDWKNFSPLDLTTFTYSSSCY